MASVFPGRRVRVALARAAAPVGRLPCRGGREGLSKPAPGRKTNAAILKTLGSQFARAPAHAEEGRHLGRPSGDPEGKAASGSVEFCVNEQFYTARGNPRGTSFPDQKLPLKVASPRNTSGGEWGWPMHESQRYRYKAAESLRAAQRARDHLRREVHLSMALSWLSLARQDEEAGARSDTDASRSAGRRGEPPRQGSQRAASAH